MNDCYFGGDGDDNDEIMFSAFATHLPGEVAEAGLELVVLEVESPTLSLLIPPAR